MVNASWHPNRATCAVSVGRSVYLLDGATGAVLHSARTPIATLALAHAPANLGARLCALLRDGSLHAVDFEDATRAAADAARAGARAAGGGGGGGAPVRRLHPPTVNVKKRGLAPSDRRGLICFGGDAATPWAVFALAGDVVLRAARLDVSRETGDGSDPGSPDSAGAGSAPVSPAFSALSSRSGSGTHTSGHTSGGSFVSSFGSSFFGKKNAKRPALLKMKGEHNKPLACVCGGGADGVDVGLVYAGYADGAVFCYDLRTQTCVGSASLPRAVVTQKKGGSYASTDDAADPLGIAAEKEANASRDASPRDDGPDANPNASLPGKAPNRSSNRKKPVRSKVPPPCTAMALVARGGDAVLVVADAAGRLTSWSARPKPPEFYPEPERKTTASATASGAFGGDALSERPVSERPTEGQKPLKMKKRKLGPGGAPALELLSGARASDSNAPAFALGALPDGRGVATLVGEQNRITQSAFCVLKTFLVTVPLGRFVGVASRSRDREGGVISASTSPNNPFPPLPPATHRVALAAHPTQARVAACAAAEARVRDTRGASSDSFTAFFASGNAGGAGVGGGGDCFSRALALRDRDEAEHVSTLAVASATPPPRRARVFYLGDDTSVWSVAFAEGPKASRRCALPPPPREAEGAVPARLRVAVTAADASADDASASAAGKEKARTRVLTKELFLTLSRVPGAEHCSVACVVDGATGAIVARVAARDAVFVTTANATETGTLCLAAIAADGASVEARPASAAAATSSASSFRIDLRALLARVHLSERADAPDGDRDRNRDRDGDRSVSAYRIFDGPELGSVAVACFVDERTSVFATFRLDAQTSARSRSRVAALLLDEPGERVVAAAWQLVGRGDGSRADAAPWGGLALLTNRRLMLYEYALSDDAMTNRDVENLVNVALTKRAETRNDIGQTIGSILWVGPALLFSRADGVFVLGWDGGVSTACACGVGGGAELALSAATEDALLLFLDAADAGGAENGNATNATTTTRNGNGASGNTRFPDFPNAVPFFRPVSAADALAIGWGSLIAAKRTSDGRVSDGLTLVARRAVASAFARHDASRVSFAALAHVARSLALPGLAANVASRATHLHATERAQFLVAARRVPAALETIRTYLNSGIDPEGPRAGDRAGTGAARDVPAAATDFFLASVLFDACEAAASAGDANAAFDAASLAFGASGGTDTTALERLVEYGVADVDGDTRGDVLGDTLGGFQTIDALVERALAPGAAREACAAAARRRLRRERRHADAGGTNRMRVRPFDKAGLERASAGSGLTLGWSAVPASVAPETSGAPAGASSETSRVSVMTHADALGRRVAGAAPFHGGVEGDATRIQKVVKNEKNQNFRDAEDSGNGFGSGSGLGARRRPEPLLVPGRDPGDPESGVSAAPGVVSPPPPPFQARFAGDSETDGDSEEDDPFPWSPAEEEGGDPFAAKEGDPFQGASFGSFGSFGSGPDPFAADVSANDAFGSATHAGTEPSRSRHSGFEPEQSQVLALPGPSADREFGVARGAERGPAMVVVPSAPVAEPSEPFDVARGELAFGWDTENAPVSHAPNDATFDAFGAPFSSTRGIETHRPVIDPEGGTATFQGAPFAADAPAAVASRASLASPNPARLSLANPRESPRVAIEDEDEDDPFGAVSDEDPFGDAEEEEEEEEEEKEVSPRDATAIDSRSNRETTAAPSPFEDARRVIGAAVLPPPGAEAAPAPVEAPPPRPVARAANRTHPETLQWALRGIAALESCDYETCELAFKAATKLAVAGRAPSVRAAVKCRSYAIAARAARFARAVASTIENGSPTERAFGDDAKENRARTTHVFVLSKGNNASAARELARLARHIAALPLDAKHRACACRFAAAWHFRLGAVALGGEYLAAAAAAAASAARLEGEETRPGASARAALAPLARCARAISRGAKPGGPFASGADAAPDANGALRSAYAADANETAGWVCAATLRSLSARVQRPESADDERIRRTDAEGSGAVECARCRAAHCEAFVGGDGAACAVCDQPFRPVKVPGVV